MYLPNLDLRHFQEGLALIACVKSVKKFVIEMKEVVRMV
jgi:hypothetical protein